MWSHRVPALSPAACRWIAAMLLFASGLAASPVLAQNPETLSFGPFGTVTVYRDHPHPSHVVLFVSGDGGWNLGVIDMAKALASLDALVVGIDITHYLPAVAAKKGETCTYAAADFEALSQFVQKKLEQPRYETPVLVGYSSGATLVYALAVQAPPNTFRGAISLGFCPDLPLTKPLCKGNGLEAQPGPKGEGFSFLPSSRLETPWVAFQGVVDQVCDPAQVETFASAVGKQAEVVALPKVGHGFSVEANWMPQFKAAFTRLITAEPLDSPTHAEPVSDLPLVEVPARSASGETLALILSGDGGWASLDRQVGGELAAHGIPVVGWSSLQYFWTPRTPDGTAKDLDRALRYYLETWHKTEILLIGYSTGADILPFLIHRLPADLRSRIAMAVLIGPSLDAQFEFHLSDWLGGSGASSQYPTLPEVRALAGQPPLFCFSGSDEKGSLCPQLEGLATVVTLPGGHHLSGAYGSLAEEILARLAKLAP